MLDQINMLKLLWNMVNAGFVRVMSCETLVSGDKHLVIVRDN
jgi:hypothetical protein